MTFKAYRSTPSLKDALKAIRRLTKATYVPVEGSNIPRRVEGVQPIIELTGTVKIHGTNACVVALSNGEVKAQSRNRMLTPLDDNAGFAKWVAQHEDFFKVTDTSDGVSAYYYGEWCGENIQSTVAMRGVPKTFVCFYMELYYDDELVVGTAIDTELVEEAHNIPNHPENMFYSAEFKTYKVTLDMNDPEKAIALIDQYRDEVDADCPVAKQLGSTATTTVGEGIVWRGEFTTANGTEHTTLFKHKGKSHERGKGSKPAKASVSVELTPEQKRVLTEFLKRSVHVDRLMQGVEYLTEMGLATDKSKTGAYLKWMLGDIKKEHEDELVELAVDYGIPWKGVVSYEISKMSKNWFWEFMDSEFLASPINGSWETAVVK